MPKQKVTKFAYQANTKGEKLGVTKDIMVYKVQVVKKVFMSP
jgi:hypothetical protein